MSDLDSKVVEFVRQVTGAMGLNLEVTIEETPDNIRINLDGDGADAFLRRKGEALDALQVIVNTVFRRDARGDRHYVVDAVGFRKGKDAELRQMAQFLMEKARTTGVVQEIGPLNPYARRIVHLTLADHESVTTHSEGEGDNRRVIVEPTPDYVAQHGGPAPRPPGREPGGRGGFSRGGRGGGGRGRPGYGGGGYRGR